MAYLVANHRPFTAYIAKPRHLYKPLTEKDFEA